jgi:hypothetical protein
VKFCKRVRSKIAFTSSDTKGFARRVVSAGFSLEALGIERGCLDTWACTRKTESRSASVIASGISIEAEMSRLVWQPRFCVSFFAHTPINHTNLREIMLPAEQDAISATKQIATEYKTAREKYCYFLLTASGACIGYGVENVKNDLRLEWKFAFLALSLIAWGISFWLGCKAIKAAEKIILGNANWIKSKTAEERSDIDWYMRNEAEKSQSFSEWQFRLFVFGGISFVLWRLQSLLLQSGLYAPLIFAVIVWLAASWTVRKNTAEN